MFYSVLLLSVISVFITGGFPSILPREKPRHARLRKAKLTENLNEAWTVSERYNSKMDGSAQTTVYKNKHTDLTPSLKQASPPPYSSLGLNSNNYNNFTFNTNFNSLSKPDYPGTYYDQYGPTIRTILDFLDAGLPYYGQNQSVFVLLQDSLLKAFQNETGTVFYSIQTKRWMFCGWLDLFLNDYFYLRLCAKLTSFGLADITRTPIANEDYISTNESGDIVGLTDRTVNAKTVSDGNNRLPSPAARSVIDVDLINYEDAYEQNCTFFFSHTE